MKATHHSGTYGRPYNIIGKLLNFTARCQSKNIVEQYDTGVRVFDVRVRELKEDSYDISTYIRTLWHVAHGHVVYELSPLDIFEELNDICYASQQSTGIYDPVYVRLTLEETNPSEYQIESYTIFCDCVSSIFPYVCFTGFYLKSTKEQVHEYTHMNSASYPKLHEVYSSVDTRWYGRVLSVWPWLWSKLFNKKTSKGVPSGTVWMQDFV